jgi:hypothetical protein
MAESLDCALIGAGNETVTAAIRPNETNGFMKFLRRDVLAIAASKIAEQITTRNSLCGRG